MISIRSKNKGKGSRSVPQRSGFMNISQKTDCGLFLLVQLAKSEDDEAISLKNVAEENGLSFYFLQKVALNLRKAGLIKAVRGKMGGYILVKDPSKIKLIEILEALEGPFALMHCLNHNSHIKTCGRENDCQIRGGLGMINDIIYKSLSKYTLKDFINSKWQRKS